jgi:hypothetical protein
VRALNAGESQPQPKMTEDQLLCHIIDWVLGGYDPAPEEDSSGH